MSKKSLRECKMSEVAYLDEAVRMSKDMTRMRTSGPGGLEKAMRSIETEYGIDYWALWTLRYRRHTMKDIGINLFTKLQAAYRAECERQLRKLQNEIIITEELAGADNAAVKSARTVVGAFQETPANID